MFLPVACSACGKPFQVPEGAIGKSAVCPWCQAAVLALPVAAPATGTPGPGLPARPAAEPLSLDEEAVPAESARRGRRFLVLVILLVAVAATLATVTVLRRKEGYLTSREWRVFTAPDGSCTAELTGRPVEDASEPESGERRFVAEGWYSGTVTWLGWRTLSAAEAQIAAAPEAWHNPQLTKLFDQERNWLTNRFGGYVTKDATIGFQEPLTRELRLELPQGRAVERLVVHHTGPRPRLYFIGIAGKRIDDSQIRRLFDSFRAID
jgi:hypothetical protein